MITFCFLAGCVFSTTLAWAWWSDDKRQKVRVSLTEPVPENDYADWDAQWEAHLKEHRLSMGSDGIAYPSYSCMCGKCGGSRWYCT